MNATRTRGLLTSAFVGRVPSLSGAPDRMPKWWVALPAVLAVLVLLPGVVLVGGLLWLVLRRRPDRVLARVLFVLGALVAVVGVLAGSYLPALGAVLGGGASLGAWTTVAGWSLLGLPLGPLWWMADQRHRERQPMGGPAERVRREQAEATRRRGLVHAVQAASAGRGPLAPLAPLVTWRAVPEPAGQALLGVKLAGDLAWPTGPAGSVVVPKPPVVQHLVVLGATGSGKSEGVWRIVEPTISTEPGEHVIYINCKPSGLAVSASDRLEQLAAVAGRSCRVLKRGELPFDPMRGTPEQIHQRLMAVEEWSEPWYQHLASTLLALALELARRLDQSPESLGQLVHQLLHGGLSALAADDDRAAQVLAQIEAKDDHGLVIRLMDQAMQLAGWIGPASSGGWSWEDADVIGMDLPTGDSPGTARMLLRLAMQDLAGWITSDRRPRRADGHPVPLTLVLEEFAALDNDPVLAVQIVNMMERARSSDVRLILVAQDPKGLGDDRSQAALLTNSVVITGRQAITEIVEQLAGLAGTRLQAEGSVAYEPGLDQLRGSVRMQHTFAVDPNMLRQLARGEVIVIDSGRWGLVAVAMTKAGYGVPPKTLALEAHG